MPTDRFSVVSRQVEFFALAVAALASPVPFGVSPVYAATPCEWRDVDDDAKLPNLAGCASFRLTNDALVAAGAPKRRADYLFVTVETLTTFQLTRPLSVFLHTTYEPVRERTPGRSRYLQDQGLYAEELGLTWAEKDILGVAGLGFEFVLGKWDMGFGRAYNDGRTVYANDVATDYEFKERIGLLWTFIYEPQDGVRIAPYIGIFTRDNWLTGAAFKNRDSLGPDDGGRGNTGRLDSFTLGVDAKFAALGDLEAWIAYADHGRSPASARRERAFVVGVWRPWKLADDLSVRPMLEFAHFENFDNAARERRDYLTAAVKLEAVDLVLPGTSRVALGYTWRSVEASPGTERASDHLLALTAGHIFAGDIDVALGYKYSRTQGVSAHAIGVQITWRIEYGPFGVEPKPGK